MGSNGTYGIRNAPTDVKAPRSMYKRGVGDRKSPNESVNIDYVSIRNVRNSCAHRPHYYSYFGGIFMGLTYSLLPTRVSLILKEGSVTNQCENPI